MAKEMRKISFVIDKELVPTLAGLVIDLVPTFHVDKVEGEPEHRHRAVRKLNGASLTESRLNWARPGVQAIVKWMIKHGAEKEHHYSSFAKALPAVGVAEGSVSPVASAMVAGGHAQRVRKGYYKVTDKGKELAAE